MKMVKYLNLKEVGDMNQELILIILSLIKIKVRNQTYPMQKKVMTLTSGGGLREYLIKKKVRKESLVKTLINLMMKCYQIVILETQIMKKMIQ